MQRGEDAGAFLGQLGAFVLRLERRDLALLVSLAAHEIGRGASNLDGAVLQQAANLVVGPFPAECVQRAGGGGDHVGRRITERHGQLLTGRLEFEGDDGVDGRQANSLVVVRQSLGHKLRNGLFRFERLQLRDDRFGGRALRRGPQKARHLDGRIGRRLFLFDRRRRLFLSGRRRLRLVLAGRRRFVGGWGRLVLRGLRRSGARAQDDDQKKHRRAPQRPFRSLTPYVIHVARC